MRAMILIIAVLLGGCSITEVPKEAAKPTLMPRASTYKDLVALYKVQWQTQETERVGNQRHIWFITLGCS